MLTLFGPLEVAQEDALETLQALLHTCEGCRLAALHPHNRGFIYRGNPLGRIAVVDEAPRETETEKGVALSGSHGREVERWLRLIGLNTQQDVFFTTVIQCQPPRVVKNGEHVQRAPEASEINACFGPRCLRMLRAMPNLEAVISMGWVSAGAFLGSGDSDQDVPKAKTHDGQWFESSVLPGIPIFCMVDPLWVIKNSSQQKNAVVEFSLERFQREFLETGKVKHMAQEARKAREARGEGLL